MYDVSDCSGERGQEHLQQWSFVDQTIGPFGLWRTNLQHPATYVRTACSADAMKPSQGGNEAFMQASQGSSYPW